jgi:hypothetical protein
MAKRSKKRCEQLPILHPAQMPMSKLLLSQEPSEIIALFADQLGLRIKR